MKRNHGEPAGPDGWLRRAGTAVLRWFDTGSAPAPEPGDERID